MPLQYSSRECTDPAAVSLNLVYAVVWAVSHVRACEYSTVTCYSFVTGVTAAPKTCGDTPSLHIIV